jgi:hypothetical protein
MSGMNNFNQYDNTMAEFWKQYARRHAFPQMVPLRLSSVGRSVGPYALSACLSAYLPGCLSVRPSVRPSACLSVRLAFVWLAREIEGCAPCVAGESFIVTRG